VLAAGNGDRFINSTHQSKLLTRLLGVPLIIRTLTAARRAGIDEAHVVIGYQADQVRAAIERHAIPGLTLGFHVNDRWHEENGVSVLAAREALESDRFALLMGDHVFDWRVLRRLMDYPAAAHESLLAIDRVSVGTERAVEATKVRTRAGLVTAIGKDLLDFDALDMGVFVCTPHVFAALDESCAGGDTTLSGGIRRLAARGMVRGVEIGTTAWCDIDTVEDLVTAERLLRRPQRQPV
jgi:choline kinase